MVRYHSLVVDAESLPDELIPIAWTYSRDALSFIETQKSDVPSEFSVGSFPTKPKNGSFSPFSCSGKVRSEKVLMGIVHSTRPHYGLQVGCMFVVFVIISDLLLCAILSDFSYWPSQFHPESIATFHGRQIFKNFREITEDYWLNSRASFIKKRNFDYTGKLEFFSGKSVHLSYERHLSIFSL